MTKIYEHGDIIRQLREEKGMSVEKCANICALTLDSYIRLESGERKPDYSELVLLGNALGFSPSAFQNGQLIFKKDLPDPASLIDQLEKRIEILEEGFKEIKIVLLEIIENTMSKSFIDDVDDIVPFDQELTDSAEFTKAPVMPPSPRSSSKTRAASGEISSKSAG